MVEAHSLLLAPATQQPHLSLLLVVAVVFTMVPHLPHAVVKPRNWAQETLCTNLQPATALLLHLVEEVEEVSTPPAVLTLTTAFMAPRAFAREEQVQFLTPIMPAATPAVVLEEAARQTMWVAATRVAVLGEDTAVELGIIEQVRILEMVAVRSMVDFRKSIEPHTMMGLASLR